MKKNNYFVASIVNDNQFELTRKCLQLKHLITYIFMSFRPESVQHNLLLNKTLNLSMYIINIIYNTPWKVYTYSIYALVGLYQNSHSFAALTRSISDT